MKEESCETEGKRGRSRKQSSRTRLLVSVEAMLGGAVTGRDGRRCDQRDEVAAIKRGGKRLGRQAQSLAERGRRLLLALVVDARRRSDSCPGRGHVDGGRRESCRGCGRTNDEDAVKADARTRRTEAWALHTVGGEKLAECSRAELGGRCAAGGTTVRRVESLRATRTRQTWESVDGGRRRRGSS